MISYAVLIRVGPYEFVKPFATEQEAVQCFDSLAERQDWVVDEGTLSVPANALVDTVTIRRYDDNIDRLSDPLNPVIKEGRIGDPTRR